MQHSKKHYTGISCYRTCGTWRSDRLLEDHQTIPVIVRVYFWFGANRGSILNSCDTEEVLSHNITWHFSLTVLSNNTSTLNTDEILEIAPPFFLAAASRTFLNLLREVIFTIRIPADSSSRDCPARRRRTEFRPPYELNLGCLITNGIVCNCPSKHHRFVVEPSFVRRLNATSVKIAKWRIRHRQSDVLCFSACYLEQSCLKKTEILREDRST